MLLLVFYNCICSFLCQCLGFNPSLCCFSPFHHFTMLLVRIHSNRASVYACLLVTAVYLDGFKWGIHSRLCSKEN